MGLGKVKLNNVQQRGGRSRKCCPSLISVSYTHLGTKCFITGGARASVLIIFAQTKPELGVRGLSAIIVEKGTPGFTSGKIEEKMGLAGSETAELVFEDCRVPAANLVGKEGQGFKIAMEALDGARVGVGASAVGLAEGAIDLSVKYMHELSLIHIYADH